jgi:hypothetical protein
VRIDEFLERADEERERKLGPASPHRPAGHPGAETERRYSQEAARDFAKKDDEWDPGDADGSADEPWPEPSRPRVIREESDHSMDVPSEVLQDLRQVIAIIAEAMEAG